jgi:hypothetical protein
MRLPIDTTALAFICAGAAQAAVDYDTRRPKTDDNGIPLFQVALVAMGDGTADVINCKIPGEPTGLAAGGPVRLVELVAIPWTMGDRSGVAYRATRIEPLTAPPGTTGSSGGGGREKGVTGP